MLNYVVKDVLETQFRGGNTDSTVAAAIRLGEVTAEIVSHDQFAAGDFAMFCSTTMQPLRTQRMSRFMLEFWLPSWGMKPANSKKSRLQAYCVILVN